MEATRLALREGRRLANEGRYVAAMDAWKAVLSGSYALQDYAGMFVLSSNIGEACVEIATRSTDGNESVNLLREATENLYYALQLVDQFSLRDVLGGYRALYRSVRRVEAMNRKAEKMMEKLQLEEKAAKRKEATWTCTTCGVASSDVVLDENDGSYYCRACYDEYYGAVETTGSEMVEDLVCGTGDEQVAVEAVDVLDTSVESERDEELCKDDVEETVALTADPTLERIKDECVSGDEETDDVAHDRDDEMTSGRLRYERVELGSLADFLAGKVYLDDHKKQHIACQQNSLPRQITGPSTAAITHRENAVIESVADVDVQTEESCLPVAADSEPPPSLSDLKEAARGEEVSVSNEDFTETAPVRFQYSIDELLELRQISVSDCPEALLDSPVYDDGTVLTPVHTKPNNSRKKPKKTARSAVSHMQNKMEAELEKANDTHSTSPLPTPDMVNAMRNGLEDWRRQGNTRSLWDNGAVLAEPFNLP